MGASAISRRSSKALEPVITTATDNMITRPSQVAVKYIAAILATLAIVGCVLLFGGHDGESALVAEDTASIAGQHAASSEPTIVNRQARLLQKGGGAIKKAKKAAKTAKKKAKKKAKKVAKKVTKVAVKAAPASAKAASGEKGAHSKLAAAQLKSAKKKKARLMAKKKKMKLTAKADKKKLKLKKKAQAAKAKLIKKKLAASKKLMAKAKAKEIKHKSKNTKKLLAQKQTIKRLHNKIKRMNKLHSTEKQSYRTQIHALDKLHIP